MYLVSAAAALLAVALVLPAAPARADFYGLLGAARAGDLAAVRLLLAAGESPNPPGWEDGYAPLQFAAGNGDVEMTRLLLAAGADTEYRDHNGDRALIWAARWGHDETVRLLLEAGSPPDSGDDPYHDSPLMAAARYAHLGVMRLLLEAGADPNWRGQSQDTPLHEAALTDEAAAVRMLLAAGADPNLREDVFDETPLHVAALWSGPATVASLVAAGAETELRAREGETPLFIAARSGNGGNVRELLEAGADPDAPDMAGRTPILAAISSLAERPGRLAAIEALAGVTAHVNRAFAEALGAGLGRAALLLLERGADVDALDSSGRSALANTVRFSGLTYFQLLLGRGADLDRFGAETLLAAAESGHMPIARALLQRGLEVDVRNQRGATPLLLAAMNAHVDMVKLLLAAGAERVPVDALGYGAEDYMEARPGLYEERIARRRMSRAWRPTEALEAALADIRARQAEIRLLLGGQ